MDGAAAKGTRACREAWDGAGKEKGKAEKG